MRQARELPRRRKHRLRPLRPTVGLVENFGPALLDRAVLDALCRALGISFYDAIRRTSSGLDLRLGRGFSRD